jgi:NSS family neurotransmitter:Na+ symporter
MLSGFLILSYYSVVAGEVMAYIIRMASGQFEGQSADAVTYLYNNFRSSTETLLAWHTLFMVVTCIIVARGVRRGLEKAVSLMMPLLVGLLLILVANALQTDTFVNGASFLFDPDFKKLFYLRDSLGQYILDANGAYQMTYKGIMTAMGHAFFTLGLGVGTIIIYGAYLKTDVSVAGVTVSVALADTLIALLAGLAIFPIVFAYGLSTAQGPGLVFTTLPVAFGSMTHGAFLGSLFYLSLFFAALTSAIALIEPTVVWLLEKYQMTRVEAVTWSGLVCWLLGVISVFSVSGTTLRDIFASIAAILDMDSPDLGHRFFDLSGFQFIDALVTLVLLPLVGLLIAIFTGWIIRPDPVREAMHMKSQVLYKVWRLMIRYVTPVLVVVIFVFALQEWVNTYVLFRPVL